MNLDEYQDAARKTGIYRGGIARLYASKLDEFSLLYTVGKLNGEAGEVGELVAKGLRDGYFPMFFWEDSEYREKLIKELGDVLWYVAMIADEIDVSLSTVALRNIDKLSSRQERGVLGGSGDER